MLLVQEKYQLTHEEIDFTADLLDGLNQFGKDKDGLGKHEFKKLINLETELRTATLKILKSLNSVMYQNRIRSKQNGQLNKIILKLAKSELL